MNTIYLTFYECGNGLSSKMSESFTLSVNREKKCTQKKMKMVEEKKPTEILFQQKNNNNEQNKTK